MVDDDQFYGWVLFYHTDTQLRPAVLKVPESAQSTPKMQIVSLANEQMVHSSKYFCFYI